VTADLLVLGQDPRLGGGGLAQTEAFWKGAAALGRSPHLVWLGYRGTAARQWPATPVCGDEVRGLVPGLDALNQLAAAARSKARVRAARSAWVVAAVASHGAAAALSNRGYGCWIGTTQDAEWRARGPWLSGARRAAWLANAPVLRRLERTTLRRAAAVYATSAASRAEVAAAGGLREDDVRILPIPVDTEAFSPLPDDDWLAGLETPTLVFVGRGWDPRKNVPLLLDAFVRIRRRLPHARLRLVGEPPRTRLPEGVEACGEVASVADHLRDAALFVLPSRQEGFGIVAAEALAAGVPVLTTPSGGPERLVRDSGGGRVLTAGSADELAEVAAELLEDRDTLAALRRAGREYVLREHAEPVFRRRLAEALRELDA
jgi:glycosyltransferase involved in cell wall biosynthesis